NVDGNAGQHREMTREALDIILRLWSDEPEFDHKGKYWHVTKTGTMIDTLKPHIAPLQKPHPPIGVAGVSKGSDTLKLAGERGFWPMSLNLNPAYVASHWESVELVAARAGAAGRRGHAEVQVHGPEVKSARIALALLLVLAGLAAPAAAAPDGTLTWGLHVTLATKWVDPSDTEAFINPFMVLYAIHDA